MDITLEKIELVKDRTGVSYKDAKQALIDAEGSVVDAIISIEEAINNNIEGSVEKNSGAIFATLKNVIAKGNATRIVVKDRSGDVILNIPLNAGVVGALISPMLIVVSTVVSFGFKCVIEVIKNDGSVVDISEKASKTIDKAGEVYEKVKNSETVEKVVDKAGDAIEKTTETVKQKFKKAEKLEFDGDLGVEFDDTDEL